jgi:hypothetical protein
MGACVYCGGTDHSEALCPRRTGASSSYYPGAAKYDSLAQSAASDSSIRGVSHPASRPFRECRAQLRLALSQREEDPARVWLELTSIRENASKLPDMANDDPMLRQDIERFRAKLEAEIFALQQEVGDEVLAPLYVWVDLIRRRNRLDRAIVAARDNVKASRAARGDPKRAARTEAEADTQLAEGHKLLDWWQTSQPQKPSEAELAIWEGGKWLERRQLLPQEPRDVAVRGTAARALLGAVSPGRLIARSTYAGSPTEKILLPCVGAFGFLASLFAAFATSRPDAGAGAIVLVVLAVLGWLGLAGAIAVSVMTRRRARDEGDAAVATSWHYTLFREQVAAVDIEVGWLRALRDAFHARTVFDNAKAEGRQIEDLKRWRADLRDFVVEVANRGDEAAIAEIERSQRSVPPQSAERT